MKAMERIKAIYAGVDGVPVKIWDNKRGIIHRELFVLHADGIHGRLLRLIEKNTKQ